MPNSGRYPCGNCNYVAASRRMLSRHTAIAHASQAFKCPLCPFVSCYQANLYRHKRDIHGLGRMTACEICGFFSSSVEDLIEHKENNHQDQIEWLKKKYANERARLGVETKEEADALSTDGENLIKKEDEFTEIECRPAENNENVEDVALEDKNADEALSRNNETTSSEMKSGKLGPIKIRRSYTCEECGLTTIDPREYLYHRRDVHGEKMTVHECKYCIYASRHVQKLQRHCALVHRQQMPVKKNVPSNVVEMTDTAKDATNDAAPKTAGEDVENWKCVAADELQANNIHTQNQPTRRKVMPIKLLKCSECPFQAHNNLHLIEHKKDVHRKKKDYECSQCGYDTDNKSRFTRHIKYHDVPKLKCSFCDFKTPYKWNMDRHLRNHIENGEYECNKCSFKTHAKQSLTVHLDYHHGNTSFNPKAKRPRLQTARKQRVINNDSANKLYSDNAALSEYAVDGDEENDVDIDQLDDDDDDDDPGSVAAEEDILEKNPYLFQPSPEENMQKQSSYGSYKQHSCPLCDVKFNQLSSLGQHLKEGHPESDNASTIAAVVDMLSPQKHKSRENPRSTPSSGLVVTSKKPQFENKDKSVPTCKICGYKTRWVSELLKHERVHSGEKPFECHICEYKCKWKGDLTRHLQKFHKKRQQITPKILGAVDEEDDLIVVPNNNQTYPANGSIDKEFCDLKPASFNEQESPLDLTVTKKSSELVLLPALLGNTNKSVNNFHIPKERPRFVPKHSFPLKRQHSEYEILEPPSKIIKKYKCTFCGFMTRTASRFHVHMVQHFDKRPFVCSACGYRSNWQWDITKHIKMKSARDDSHMNATLIITDQTGEKNYEKYKSYLVDVEESRVVKKVRISHRVENKQFHDVESNDDGSYIDMASVTDEPENIVVTPDLPFSFEDPNQSRPAFTSFNEELALESHQNRPVLNNTAMNENNTAMNDPIFERYKLFHCKHCSYKHREKKVVVSHLAEHAGIKLFRCRVCGVSSNWKNVILRHVKTHHGGQLKYVEELITYTVEGHVVCLTGIKKQQDNTNLMQIASPRKDATRHCSICPFTCLKENHFQFHMKQHQPREGTCFKCMFCPYYVKFRKTLIRHLELHKNESAVRNEPARYVEENSDPAELFMKENCDNDSELPESNDSQQDITDMPYHDEQQVNRDNFYVREKRHSCEQCPYKTDNKTQYLYHKQFHRPNKSAKFKCKLCSYWATHHHLIAQHQRVHNTEQSLSVVDAPSNRIVQSSQESGDNQCVEEQLDYDENRQIRPIVVKRGEFYFRMFKCNYCPMMNKRRANVRVHEKMHAKSKVSKYTCPLCNYKCNNQGIITAHMKIHGNNSAPFISGSNNNTITMGSTCTAADTSQPQPLKRKRVFSYFCMRCPAVFKSTADLEIHKTFHTMSYPLPCPTCDYRAKNKACLHKHLLVHTPEYVAKREASYGPPVMTTVPETNYVIKSSEASQMLLLEDAEMKAVIEGNAIHSPQRLHRCTLCPVAFFKATTLQYHLSLHGSNGLYSCSYCNYAVDKNENLISHVKLHISPPKLMKPKVPTMFFSCPKCPAFFDKVNRYNRHLQLHGQKNKYTCEQCDYSVRLPANLFNHKIVHTKSYAERKHDISFVSQETTALGFTLSLESKNLVEDPQKKRSFACDRCPYFYMRKDAVQRHQKRHNPGGGGGEGLSCPYCDYSSLQLSFLRDHVRVHFQSEGPFRAQAFMKHEEYEIWSVDDGKREMLFKDGGAQKSNQFYPSLDKDVEDLFAAEGETPGEISFVEHQETDIPNRKVPFVNSALFNENLEQLSVSQTHLESSSQQLSSNSDEKNDLVEDVLNQSKKLEVILTDVFSGGNKAAIMKAINNEAVSDQPEAQDISLEEGSFIPWENDLPSPKLIKLEDVNPKIENESRSDAIKEDSGTEKRTESVELTCGTSNSSALVPLHTIDTNINTVEHEMSVPDESDKILNNGSCLSKEETLTAHINTVKHDMLVLDERHKMLDNSSCLSEEILTGTNSNNSFDVRENEKLTINSSNNYFNTEFFDEEKPSIPNNAVSEMEQKTENINSQDVVACVASDKCDNISDIEVNMTVASHD